LVLVLVALVQQQVLHALALLLDLVADLAVLVLVALVVLEPAVRVLVHQVQVVRVAVLRNAVVLVVVLADHNERRLHVDVAMLMS